MSPMADATQTKQEWYADGLSFSCTQCGNCCTGPPGYVWFNDDEARAMAAHLGMSLHAFLAEYTHRIMGKRSLNEQQSEQGYDCVFLRRDEAGKALCSIYEVRPAQCRTWPFWKGNLRSPASWQRVQRGCPGAGHGKFFPVEQIRVLRDSLPDL